MKEQELDVYSDAMAATIRRMGYDINRLVGNATAKPISQPEMNLWRKPTVKPVIIAVIVKDIVVSKAKVIKNAVKRIEDLLFTFKACLSFSWQRLNQVYISFYKSNFINFFHR